MEPSVLSNNIMGEFEVTASTFGAIVSMAYLPYIIMQIPCGVILDRVGAKTVVVVSNVLLALGAFIFGAADSVTQLKIGRLIIGLASSAGFISCGKVVTDLFPLPKHSLLIGVGMFLGCIGGIAGTSPTACLINMIGWRYTTFVLAAFGIIVSLLAMRYMKADGKPKNDATDATSHSIIDGLKLLVKSSQAWILGLYGALAYLPLGALAEVWIVPFMERRFSISTEQAAVASILILVGYGLGAIVAAKVADVLKSGKMTVAIFSAATVILFWVALNSDSIGFVTCLVLLFAGGLGAGTNTIAFAMIYRCVPEGFGGTSAGFMNSVVMSSVPIFQVLLGTLLDFFRNGTVDNNGAPVYTVDIFRGAFLFFIAALVIAFVSTLFIKEHKGSMEAGQK
ncbi:MAG: MFS transporter [Holosporales bacterium]|jgi:predicted MFS family arabinose efflux permease|nr:MFS transporter [Holosporales bacterium]